MAFIPGSRMAKLEKYILDHTEMELDGPTMNILKELSKVPVTIPIIPDEILKYRISLENKLSARTRIPVRAISIPMERLERNGFTRRLESYDGRWLRYEITEVTRTILGLYDYSIRSDEE
jgi:hypothetical protein